jgi:hypothetical protein
MDKKRSRITYLMVAGTLCLAAWAASAMPRLRTTPKILTPPEVHTPEVPTPPPVVSVPKVKPKVEVVFALDTTGSMSGLIDGAKRKIWSIAHFMQQAQPKPEVRIGLVAFRDKGDEYVTRFYDLSDDLDKVFERLQTFEAGGGGDTPEHVSKALHDAVFRASWSADQGTLKQIYLVGDAPPHTDYNDYDYRTIAKTARDKGIHINTVRCGGDRQTQLVWNEISNIASGEYASIDQGGGMMAVATPFDDKMAELNGKLVNTAIGYGRYRGEVRSKAEAAMAAPKSTAADRASFFGAKGGAVGGRGDYLDDLASGSAPAPAAMPAADLPAEMAALDGEGRRKYVEQKRAEREKISSEINTLAKKRDAFLKDKGPSDSFDRNVERAIKAQAASVGLAY